MPLLPVVCVGGDLSGVELDGGVQGDKGGVLDVVGGECGGVLPG